MALLWFSSLFYAVTKDKLKYRMILLCVPYYMSSSWTMCNTRFSSHLFAAPMKAALLSVAGCTEAHFNKRPHFSSMFLQAALKSLSFVLFSCVCLIAALYVFFILPETKGKTPLEISQEFKNIRACGSSKEDAMCLETKL